MPTTSHPPAHSAAVPCMPLQRFPDPLTFEQVDSLIRRGEARRIPAPCWLAASGSWVCRDRDKNSLFRRLSFVPPYYSTGQPERSTYDGRDGRGPRHIQSGARTRHLSALSVARCSHRCWRPSATARKSKTSTRCAAPLVLHRGGACNLVCSASHPNQSPPSFLSADWSDLLGS